jgi:putative flippase GtrA
MGPVFLIDDGSGENYKAIFEKASQLIEKNGGILLVHSKNQGKGRALKTAFNCILNTYPEIQGVVTADSDGQHTPACIKKVSQQMKLNKEALVLGVRKFDEKDIPWKSRLGNKLTEKLFKYISGVHITDTQTGLRGIPKSYMKELVSLKGERFEFEMRMLLDAAERYEIKEVPIQTIYESATNHQTHFKPIKDSMKIYSILGEKFLKYIFSSLSSSVIDLFLFEILCIFLINNYPRTYVILATVFARIISAIYNYFLNYKVVFKSQENIRHSAIKYITLAILQMICSAILVTISVSLLALIPEVVIKAIIDTFLFFVSYCVQQRFVFKKQADF